MPSNKDRWYRKEVYNYIKTHPFCTIEDITRYLGLDKYLGGSIMPFCILIQLSYWGLIEKYKLVLLNPIRLEEAKERTKKIFRVQDLTDYTQKKRVTIFKRMKERDGWEASEMKNALHVGKLMTLEEFVERSKNEDAIEVVVTYKLKPTKFEKLRDMIFNLYNTVIEMPWNGKSFSSSIKNFLYVHDLISLPFRILDRLSSLN